MSIERLRLAALELANAIDAIEVVLNEQHTPKDVPNHPRRFESAMKAKATIARLNGEE